MRCRGRPRSATASRTVSMSASPATCTSTSPAAVVAASPRSASRAIERVAVGADVDGEEPGALQEGAGGARDDQVPAVEHDDVVAHLLHVVEQVGGEQHRDAEPAEPGDEVEHLLATHRVEAGGRLVEEHELRVGHDRLGELGALAHAGGEARRRAGTGPRRGRRGRARPTPAGGRRGRGSPLSSPKVATMSAARLVEREAVVLGHVAELAAHADRIVGHVDPAHLEASLGGVAQPEHHPEEGRLAGAVGPDEADAPGWDVEIEPFDGRDTGVSLGQSPRPEERRGRGPRGQSVRQGCRLRHDEALGWDLEQGSQSDLLAMQIGRKSWQLEP